MNIVEAVSLAGNAGTSRSGVTMVLTLGVALLGLARVAGAQDAAAAESRGGRDWLFAVSMLRDEARYEHSLVSFHVAAAEETWFSVAAGRSHAPSAETDVRADLVTLGFEHDFGGFGVALNAERWGDSDNIESADWNGEVFFGGDRYRVALRAEQRSIDIFFSGDGAPVETDLRRIGVDADGFGVDWRVRLTPAWRAYGSWMEYDYPNGMRLIPRADRLDLLSTSTVTLAYSFVDRYQRIGFERALGQKLVSFDYGRDRSTIDGGTFRSLAASVLWPIASRMDLEFQFGTGRVGGLGSRFYGGLSLLIYGAR